MPVSTGLLLLIKDRDAVHTIPAKDAMCYKRGDIVQVFDVGTSYVVPCAEPFYLIEVTNANLTAVDQARYQSSEVDADSKPMKRRAYYMDLAALPAKNAADLTAQRFTSMNWGTLRSRLKNKATGQGE